MPFYAWWENPRERQSLRGVDAPLLFTPEFETDVEPPEYWGDTKTLNALHFTMDCYERAWLVTLELLDGAVPPAEDRETPAEKGRRLKNEKRQRVWDQIYGHELDSLTPTNERGRRHAGDDD